MFQTWLRYAHAGRDRFEYGIEDRSLGGGVVKCPSFRRDGNAVPPANLALLASCRSSRTKPATKEVSSLGIMRGAACLPS
ncbi:hypothetical protein GFPCMMHI_05773 [Ensifer adhaerens]|nr:hypothetical protein [Ensifer adhaerens]